MIRQLTILFISFTFIFLSKDSLLSKNIAFSLFEEDRSLWNELLKDNTIRNKNLLYASYVAYKDRLNDLSIETFRECIRNNSTNEIVVGIANYYIGKNLFLIGQYKEAINHFKMVSDLDLSKFYHIKFAVLINTAIAYHRLNDLNSFRTNLQMVIEGDKGGKYNGIAQGILSQIE